MHDTDGLPIGEIGIIWQIADGDACPFCQYLNGRWFDAKDAYKIVSTICPSCRCSKEFDVGLPEEALVGPIPSYRPGTSQDIHIDLNIDRLISARETGSNQSGG
jgi:hypothetical protein